MRNLPNSKAIFFKNTEYLEDCEDWSNFIEAIRVQCIKYWPSLTVVRKWIGDYELAILENKFCYIGVTEQRDTAAIWLVIKVDCPQSVFAENWCNQAIVKFKRLENIIA